MSNPVDRPFDIGLQAERTALSWQRTTLASAVGFLLAARLLVEIVGPTGVFVAAAGLILTAALFLVGYRRYRSTHRILVSSAGEPVALASAIPLFLWAAIVFLLAIVGLVSAVLMALLT